MREERKRAADEERHHDRDADMHQRIAHMGELIRIADDGAGLDVNGIRATAMEKGLIQGNAADLSDGELFQFILAPGFSTAKKVTGVSGRGVGLDVVKKAIDALRGSTGPLDRSPGITDENAVSRDFDKLADLFYGLGVQMEAG